MASTGPMPSPAITPRPAPQSRAEKERAALGLGLIAQVEGKEDEALEWFERCVAESVSGMAAAEAQLDTFCNSARFADRKLAEFLRGRRGLVSGRGHAIPYQEGGQHMLALAAVAAARGDAALERRFVAEALGPYNRNHITFAIAWSWMHRRGWDPRRYVDAPANGPSGRPAP